jgi:hypothetical protein
MFTASNQTLETIGLPIGDTRAILKITGADQSTALVSFKKKSYDIVN